MNVSSAAPVQPSPARTGGLVITPTLFAVPFGIAGLSNTWRTAGPQWAAVVGDSIAVVATVLTVAMGVGWVAQVVRRESDVAAELRDPLQGPSVPALPIAAMLVSATLFAGDGTPALVLVAVFTVLTLAAGVAVVGAWSVTRLPLVAYHPGFYLPTAGVALLAAQCVVGLRWTGFAQALFFIGLASWLVLGVVTSLRLLRTPLPLALRPVLTIEIAAPALAGNTYLVVFHRFDGYALALAVVTAAMGIVQLALVPYFRRAPFGPAFWVSSFSCATTATLVLRWVDHERPPATEGWRIVTLTLATGVVVLLGVVTAHVVRRGGFVQRRPTP